jgi:hypothetical protein
MERLMKWRVILGMLIALLSSFSQINYAQDNLCTACTFVFRSDFQNNLIRGNTTLWLPDSQSFVFNHFHDNCSCDYLYQFSVESSQLQKIDQSPFMVTLTPDEKRTFTSADDVVFISPDGQFIVYNDATGSTRHCAPDGRCWYPLALGNLTTGKRTELYTGYDPGPRQVIWSADSSAFLIIDWAYEGSVGGVWYVDAAQTLTQETAPLLLIGYGLGEQAFVDISRDGRRILLRAYPGFYLWDARMPIHADQQFAALDSPRILDKWSVVGAAFVPGDNQQLLAVTEQGIIRYNLETGDIKTLSSAVNSTWAGWVLFSPDTRYAAIYSKVAVDGDFRDQLDIFQLPDADFAPSA